MTKYGIDSFEFEVIEYCENDSRFERESYWFNELRPSYNVWPTIYSAKGRIYTPEQMKTIFPYSTIKNKKEFSDKLVKAWKKRRLRPDGIATLSMLDRTGKKHTEETKKLYSEQRKGVKKSKEHGEKIRQWRLGTKWDPINRKWIKK